MQEGTTTAGDIRAYFNMYDGTYSDYGLVTHLAYWDSWVDDQVNAADQVRATS